MEKARFISTVITLLMSLQSTVYSVWKPPSICMFPVKQGPCMAYYESFFYNRTSGECQPFWYGGCGGNHNRFHTFQECFTKCSCHVPPDSGPCRGNTPRWYYNPKRGCCEKFNYGGCQGNSNNFGTFELCEAWCAGASTGRKKPWGTNWGSVNSLVGGLQWMGTPGMKWGGAKNIWLHNENIGTSGNVGTGGKVIRVVSQTGKSQIPGVQTKSNWRLLSQGMTGGVPVGQTGGSFRQISRVQNSVSPVGGTVSTWRARLGGSGGVPVSQTGGSFRQSSRVLTAGSPTGGTGSSWRARLGGRGGVPVSQTGGSFRQVSRVKTAGPPIGGAGASWRARTGGRGGVPVGPTGGSFRQSSRVLTAGSPTGGTGSSWKARIGGTQTGGRTVPGGGGGSILGGSLSGSSGGSWGKNGGGSDRSANGLTNMMASGMANNQFFDKNRIMGK